MDIKGSVTNVRSGNGAAHVYSGAMYDTGKKGECDQANGGSYANGIGFQASKNWSGSTSEEKSHTHSFESTVVIGEGDYIRPNSLSCLYLISY